MTRHNRQTLGARPGRRRLLHGRARHARRLDRAEHDPRSTSARRSTQLEWTVNAYNLSFAVLLMTARGARRPLRPPAAVRRRPGAVRARVGRLRAGAVDVGWLIAARAVQGAGAALVMPLALALVERRVPARAPRARRSALFSGVTGLAVASGPVIGGAIAEGLAWQWIFWINVPDRPRSPSRSCCARIPESRGAGRARSTCPASRSSPARRSASSGASCAATPPAGAAPRCSARSSPGVAAARRVRRAGSARRATPMLPHALLPLARVLGRQRGDLLHVRVAVRRGVLPRPVPADRARLRPARTPGCGCCRGRRRCSSSRPLAGALVDRFGERPFLVGGLLLQAVGMGWIALVAEPGMAYARAGRAAGRSPGCGVSMAFPAAQNAVVGAVAAGGDRQGRGRRTARCASSAACSGSRSRVAVFAGAGRLRVARARSPTASSRPWAWPPASPCSRRRAGWRCRAGRRCGSPPLR